MSFYFVVLETLWTGMDKATQEKWRAAFVACDINGNGFIEASELHKAFETLNVKLDDQSKLNVV
jgi:Ca2+-binding EF-hand superfamily protein